MSPLIHGLNLTGLRNTFRPDEELKFVLRRHWIVYLYLGFYAFFLVFSSIILLAYQSTIFSFISGSIFSIFLIIYWSTYLLFLYITWANNELDLFIITDQRIRGIEQLSFLNRNIAECALEDVKEVNANTKGLFENLFNYGTVSMHTASEKSNFIMHFAPSPMESASDLRNVIQDNKARRKEEQLPETRE